MDVLSPGAQEVETNEPLVYVRHVTHMFVTLIKVSNLTIPTVF